MKNGIICVWLFLAGVLSTQGQGGQASATTNVGTVTVTNTEPARITLVNLFKIADVVAIVRIVSGDTENYKTAVYRGVVVTSFKGSAKNQTLYFGPFIGQKLGWEYVLFLRNAKEEAKPTTAPTAGYGAVKYLEVFNEGYSQMENSYECVFDGKDSAQSCDYAVRVCTDYITLPKLIRTFPPEENDSPFGCRWVRKSRFISILDEFAEEPGVVQTPASAR